MAKETVMAVRQAEINSIEKEKEALKKKSIIVSEADQNAKELISSLTQQALDKADSDISDAMQNGNELLNAAKMKADNEILIIKELSLRKEEAAIDLILSNVIQ